MERKYVYLGDRLTDKKLRNKECTVLLHSDNKYIRGKNGNMLVRSGNVKVIVLARLLRKRD